MNNNRKNTFEALKAELAYLEACKNFMDDRFNFDVKYDINTMLKNAKMPLIIFDESSLTELDILRTTKFNDSVDDLENFLQYNEALSCWQMVKDKLTGNVKEYLRSMKVSC
jgi:hypothetical protein